MSREPITPEMRQHTEATTATMPQANGLPENEQAVIDTIRAKAAGISEAQEAEARSKPQRALFEDGRDLRTQRMSAIAMFDRTIADLAQLANICQGGITYAGNVPLLLMKHYRALADIVGNDDARTIVGTYARHTGLNIHFEPQRGFVLQDSPVATR